MKNNFNSLDEILRGKTTIGVSGHMHPDGDCIGSTLGVYNYIRDQYPEKQVKLYLEPPAEKFLFLQRADEIITDYPEEEGFDLFIALDVSDGARLGEAQKYLQKAACTACIDHHITNGGFADFSFIFPKASSASELVYELLPGEKITKGIAECIYMGIVHDTGVFQYSCTSAKTMAVAGSLMELGIDYPSIVDRTFYTRTLVQNQILGYALSKSALYLDGKLIMTSLTQEEMKRFGATTKDLDPIVSQIRLTKDISIALFLYENTDGTWKGSLRVNGDANVAAIAQQFGGGGHVKAAGFTIEGPFETALSRILAEAKKQLA